ncbi:MAG: response regulator transcription factor, partial [Alphaproteobacteria bacterium]|nr:response regulator transcription factor [Alphaproteobacteria bacterium]
LKEAGYTVSVCEDAVDGLHLATTETWEVIILDRMLPGQVDGLSILNTVRELGKTTPVLILSALASLYERVRGLRGGGDDYLTKPFAFGELAARLDALVRRAEPRDAAAVLAVDDLRLDLDAHEVTRAGRPIRLQPQEFKLLEYLMRHAGRVVTRTMLLENLWDYQFDPQTNVIDPHISKLRQKIDAGFDRPLLHTVRGVGYKLGVAD